MKEFKLEKSLTNANSVPRFLAEQITRGSMKESALYLSRVNLHRKLQVCLIIRNRVNGEE